MTLGAERVKMNMQRSIDTEVRHIWKKKNFEARARGPEGLRAGSTRAVNGRE